MEHLEIERKYLIRMPDQGFLKSLPSSSIEQVYILNPEGGRERIRCRETDGIKVYTHTVKKRLSNLTRIEQENEISEKEYEKLLRSVDPDRQILHKMRYLHYYKGQVFEIDVFPFWQDRALMELELDKEEQTIFLPPDIAVIRDVTAEKAYTNASIAQSIPFEKLT